MRRLSIAGGALCWLVLRASSGPEPPVRHEPLLVAPRVARDFNGAHEGCLGLLFPAQLVQQDATPRVRRGEVGSLLEDLVIGCQSFLVASGVHEQRGQPESEAKMLGVVDEPRPVCSLGARAVTACVSSQRERFPGFGVRRVEFHAACEGPDRIFRLTPA